MDGRRRRSYKMFQTQFLTPPLLLPTILLPAPPIFIFLFFTKPWYFIISSSLYPSRAVKVSHLPLSSPLLWFFPSLQPSSEHILYAVHNCLHIGSARWQVQFWVSGASEMSQLIRSVTPLRDSSVLITIKDLITGLSVDFWFSPGAR